MVYNFSKDSEYHTQINNKSFPGGSCNTTSMIMAVKQAGHKINFAPGGKQPEDVLTELLVFSEEAYGKARVIAPGAWDFERNEPKRPLNEIHVMLEWGINYLMEKTIDTFTTELEIETMIKKLNEGCGIVLSGEMPYYERTIGHMVSLAGFATINDERELSLENIAHFIIDDPFGNFRTNYRDTSGNNIKITTEEFIRFFKDCRNRTRKWAHIVTPASTRE